MTDDVLVCPYCGKNIPLSKALASQIDEQVKQRFEAAVKKREKELEEEMEAERTWPCTKGSLQTFMRCTPMKSETSCAGLAVAFTFGTSAGACEYPGVEGAQRPKTSLRRSVTRAAGTGEQHDDQRADHTASSCRASAARSVTGSSHA